VQTSADTASGAVSASHAALAPCNKVSSICKQRSQLCIPFAQLAAGPEAGIVGDHHPSPMSCEHLWLPTSGILEHLWHVVQSGPVGRAISCLHIAPAAQTHWSCCRISVPLRTQQTPSCRFLTCFVMHGQNHFATMQMSSSQNLDLSGTEI
jgi:hypothetical protein